MSKKISWYDTLEAQEYFLGLPEEDRIFLRDYKHHVEANKEQITRILYSETKSPTVNLWPKFKSNWSNFAHYK